MTAKRFIALEKIWMNKKHRKPKYFICVILYLVTINSSHGFVHQDYWNIKGDKIKRKNDSDSK